MRIYYHGKGFSHTIYVTPGVDYPHVTEWHEADGRKKQFSVIFKYGIAEVDDNLGDYMIEKGLASKSKIITDQKEVA